MDEPNPGKTHWPGCWKSHHECAIALVEAHLTICTHDEQCLASVRAENKELRSELNKAQSALQEALRALHTASKPRDL